MTRHGLPDPDACTWLEAADIVDTLMGVALTLSDGIDTKPTRNPITAARRHGQWVTVNRIRLAARPYRARKQALEEQA